MSYQYEILSKPEAYAEFFNLKGMQSPVPLADPAAPVDPTTPIPKKERLIHARRMGGFIRAAQVVALPEGLVATAVTAEPAPAEPVAAVIEAAPVEAAAVEAAAVETAPAVKPKKTVPPVQREWVAGQWGMIPHWIKSSSDAKLRSLKLTEAREETASTAQAFRDAWLNNQRCIVPMMAFYEEDWRTGKLVQVRISRVDGQPMGVAGLWARWVNEEGQEVMSYALLTINANSHALMRRYGKPGADRRMPSIINDGAYDAWLSARQDKARQFMRAYPAQWLTANPVERKEDKKPKGWLD